MPENGGYIDRFIETCGSAKPANVQRLLNISYQAAKNYLSGRLPSPAVLLVIAVRTPYSIDWLLTGRGKKFADEVMPANTPIPTGEMETFVRRICVEVVNEMAETSGIPQTTSVILRSSDLLSEKVSNDAPVSSADRS
ncbi:hypothetical protein BH20ACI2_BH20ACI2_26470 [soil metagenome]